MFFNIYNSIRPPYSQFLIPTQGDQTMSVIIDLVYEGDLHCSAVHVPSGKTLATDAPVDNGGKGETFSPTDLVATALGACVVTIMGIVAKKNNILIDGAKVRVSKDMVSDPVRRIGSLSVTVTLPKGSQFSEMDRQKLENAAKVCPVKQSLHPDTKVEIEWIYPD